MGRSAPRRRVAAIIAVTLIAPLLLAGCTAAAPTKPKATSSSSSPLRSLQPVMPAKLTKTSAKTATVNLANHIDSLVAGSDIVFIDNHERLIPATSSAGATYAIIRTINVSPSLDPIAQAEAMEKLLALAGWKLEDHSSAKGKYLAAMSSSVDPSQAWFLLLGGDATVAKQPVVTVQLASPDIPAK